MNCLEIIVYQLLWSKFRKGKSISYLHIIPNNTRIPWHSKIINFYMKPFVIHKIKKACISLNILQATCGTSWCGADLRKGIVRSQLDFARQILLSKNLTWHSAVSSFKNITAFTKSTLISSLLAVSAEMYLQCLRKCLTVRFLEKYKSMVSHALTNVVLQPKQYSEQNQEMVGNTTWGTARFWKYWILLDHYCMYVEIHVWIFFMNVKYLHFDHDICG